jgi:hypothetical protein
LKETENEKYWNKHVCNFSQFDDKSEIGKSPPLLPRPVEGRRRRRRRRRRRGRIDNTVNNVKRSTGRKKCPLNIPSVATIMEARHEIATISLDPFSTLWKDSVFIMIPVMRTQGPVYGRFVFLLLTVQG